MSQAFTKPRSTGKMMTRLVLPLTLLVCILRSPPRPSFSVAAAVAPNHFLGTCLTPEWVADMEVSLGINASATDALGRKIHPFLHAAMAKPRYHVQDPRTESPLAYSCPYDGAFFGVGAQVDAETGSVTEKGTVAGSLVIEIRSWVTHRLTSHVLGILAGEVYGYPVSYYRAMDSLFITQRMSSVHTGVCTPVHVDLEAWVSGIEDNLQVYANESNPVGGIGYFGHSGMYTTKDFVADGLDLTKYSTPIYPEFWKGYRENEELIQAIPVSGLRNNAAFFPPSDQFGCDDGFMGCTNKCSMTQACAAREASGKECMVVVMMYATWDQGYLQSALDNNDVPAYMCFLGYDGSQDYALYAQAQGLPVVFYHYEPDLFHIRHPGLFERIFLPRATPEHVALQTGTFGDPDNKNLVDVDFPTSLLTKYAASLLQDSPPIGQLISKMALPELEINHMLHEYIVLEADANEPDPDFRTACNWVRDNYAIWSLWMDRLPLCTLADHIVYAITGCDTESLPAEQNQRTITFSWVQPDPVNKELPYNCDGGVVSLPTTIVTSRSCKWLTDEAAKWLPWITKKPQCDSTFYEYNVTTCDSHATRIVQYRWLVPNETNPDISAECADGVTLPSPVVIDCEYMPTSASAFTALAAIAVILIAVLVIAIIFVVVMRNRPIIKRSQFELLVLMIVGGIMVCIAAILYGGEPTAFLCAARPTFISCGFTTIFGSLLVKSLRVYRVFMKSAMKRVTVTMRMMLKVFAILTLVDFLILGAWFIIDFPWPTQTITPARDFNGEVDRISCKSASFVFTAVLIFWKAVVLMLGLYMSFLIRNVSADFQESTWIFASSLVVLLGSLVILPLAYMVDMAAAAFYVFLAAALLLTTGVVMAMMLLPKILRLDEVARRSSNYTTNNTMGSGGPTVDDSSCAVVDGGSIEGTQPGGAGVKRVSVGGNAGATAIVRPVP